MTNGLDITIVGPALAAGLLVLATHVPLGQRVLERGIIFIDLAIAQIAGLGVIAAHSFGWQGGDWMTQVAASGAALVGAAVLYLSERRFAEVQEAIIGSAFVLAASAGILVLAANPQGSEYLRELLAGQILWVRLSDLAPVALLYGAIQIAWFSTRRSSTLQFYILFALAVTASVQLVGVYLVFASLILPALATRSRPARTRLAWGYGVGAAGYGAGIIVSSLLDLPTGATIVWTLAGAAVAINLIPFARGGTDRSQENTG